MACKAMLVEESELYDTFTAEERKETLGQHISQPL